MTFYAPDWQIYLSLALQGIFWFCWAAEVWTG